MAARILSSFLLGLSFPRCWAGPYTPPDIDFSRVEFWPLSGGVADGVQVALTARGLRAGEDAVIDFVTANYDIAFRFHMDTSNQLIVRTSWLDGDDNWGVPEYTGGWPIMDEAADLRVEFYKTVTNWAITIGGVRMPWFDFDHRTSEAVVYAAVHIGFRDGEVVDKRPSCSAVCSAQECLDAQGVSTCSGTCYSRIPNAESNLIATCYDNADTVTLEGLSCCDGRPLQHVASDDSLVDTWVKVWSDSDLVKQAVLSQTGSAATASKLETAAGNKVGIRSRENSTGLYTVWVPQLWDVDEGVLEIPADVMEETTLMARLIDNPNAAAGAVVQNDHGLITTAGSDAQFEQWWFVNMYDVRCRDAAYAATCGSNGGGNPAVADPWWVSYSNLISEGQVQAGFVFYLTDEDIGHTPCRDEALWTDGYGGNGNGEFANADCATYEARGWCMDHGVATDAFVTDHAPFSGLPVDAQKLDRPDVVETWHAGYMCCACGGGYHDAPTVAAQTILE